MEKEGKSRRKAAASPEHGFGQDRDDAVCDDGTERVLDVGDRTDGGKEML